MKSFPLALSFRCPLLGGFLFLSLLSRAAASELPQPSLDFLENHCLDCHDSASKKGGLDLESLRFEFGDAKGYAQWVRIHDRVKAGEMPPKKKARPEAGAMDQFLNAIAEPIATADQARMTNEGRATLRRLNRYEYENTLRELLGAPWLQVKDMLPEDGEAHRFNKVGDALDISHVQMSRYLVAADEAIRQALIAEQMPSRTVRYYAREQRTFIKRMTYSPLNRSPERTTTPLLDHEAQPDVFNEKVPVTVGGAEPEIREREAFGVVNGNYIGNQFHFDKFAAPAGGRYKLRFKAYSYWAGPEKSQRWWRPDRAVASIGRRPEPVTLYGFTPPREMRQLVTFDAMPEPAVHEFDVELVAGESIKPDAARLFRSRPGWKGNPLATHEGMPGVAYAWLEMEGPLPPEKPEFARMLLFGDLPLKATDGHIIEVESADPKSDAARLLPAFMRKAWRRAPQPEEEQRYVGIVHRALDSGSSFADAMIAGYTAALCAPGFLYFDEAPGELAPHNLATRLSYFLWNSPPDAELLAMAADGSLKQSEVLRAQTERLLKDPRADRFRNAFLDYWLDLRNIGSTTPDSTLYPDYYLDDLLIESANDETRLFFAELLRSDLPARNLIASDFTFLNERLALHYGMPAVDGTALRRTTLPEGSPRGGLLTQASVLKVTANGTTTSPVLRGAWIMERILGETPTPPPASVGAVEPDTRGATTIREQLEKHRNLESCNGCHSKIDPPGFALESFDILGGFRERYRAVDEKHPEPVKGIGKNGHIFAFHLALPVDASGQVADGREFRDIVDFKRLLLKDERTIARNLVKQLTVYATGAPVRFGDRPAVEQILDRAAASQYGVRSLIYELVQSQLFRWK